MAESSGTENSFKSFKAESLLNRDGDILPFGLYHPDLKENLTWHCGEDKDGKITSVFVFTDEQKNKQKQCAYLENMKAALYHRDELVKDGWKKIIPPEVVFKFPGEKEERPLNRKEKRILKKKMEQMNKHNPFEK